MPEEVEGEVTQEQIAEWKEKYGQGPDRTIHRVRLSGITYYYRALLRAELKNIMRVLGAPAAAMEGTPTNYSDQQLSMEDQNVVRAVLHPQIGVDMISAMPGGVVTNLSELILDASGFNEVAEPEIL